MEDFFHGDIVQVVKKGTLLVQQGERCAYGYKVIKGCLISYITDKTGKEHIFHFGPEGWIISDLNSFLNAAPSAVSIQALEDSEVMLIEKGGMVDYDKVSKEVIILRKASLMNYILASNKRMFLMLSSTAEERYLDFIETYPTLLQRIPLKLIASYIGITPEYLSEIRNKLSKKKHSLDFS